MPKYLNAHMHVGAGYRRYLCPRLSLSAGLLYGFVECVCSEGVLTRACTGARAHAHTQYSPPAGKGWAMTHSTGHWRTCTRRSPLWGFPSLWAVAANEACRLPRPCLRDPQASVASVAAAGGGGGALQPGTGSGSVGPSGRWPRGAGFQVRVCLLSRPELHPGRTAQPAAGRPLPPRPRPR